MRDINESRHMDFVNQNRDNFSEFFNYVENNIDNIVLIVCSQNIFFYLRDTLDEEWINERKFKFLGIQVIFIQLLPPDNMYFLMKDNKITFNTNGLII